VRTLLADGPRPVAEIMARGAEQDIAQRTLERAKGEVGARLFWVWQGQQRIGHWILPGQELPARLPPEAIELDLAEMYEKLERIQTSSPEPGH
jgi:hypothetical protein